MSWLRIIASRLAGLFRKHQSEGEMDEEFRFHLDMQVEENLRRGLSPEEARTAALRKFGGVDQAKEAYRDQRGLPFLETIWRDVVYGTRMLRNSPGFTAVAVISLALGIGATTAIFSILDGILLSPLPYPQSDRLVSVFERELDKPGPGGWSGVSMPTLQDWKEQSRSFTQLAETLLTDFVISRNEGAEEVPSRFVGEEYLDMLGARTCLGRLFTPEDFIKGKTGTLLLSNGAWQRLFGANPALVGSTINLNGEIHQVVGVMSPDFRDLGGYRVDVWLPLSWLEEHRKVRNFEVIGRLKPGTDAEKAQAEMDVIQARLAAQYSEAKGWGACVLPLQGYYYGDWKRLFLALFGAVALVLLIACANVAGLLLARGATRQKEMALRASLGAGRWRLVRQLLTESMLLSILGTGFGLMLAWAGVRIAVHFSPEGAIPRADEISINGHILGFAVLAAFLTAWLFGLFPALHTSSPDLNESLKEGNRKAWKCFGRRQVQSVFVIIQMALSLFLLIGASVMINGVWRALHANVGFNTDHLVQMTIQFIRNDYLEDIPGFRRMKPKTTLTVKGIEDRLKTLPSTKAVAVSTWGALQNCSRRPVSPDDKLVQPDGEPSCFEPVSPGYFSMLQIPLLKGRYFTEQDSKGSIPVAIINESLAQRYFPGKDPVGKTLNIGLWEFEDIERREIVGVVANARQNVVRPPLPAVYYPYSQLPAVFRFGYGGEHLFATFLVRSAIDPSNFKIVMKQAALGVARDIMVEEAQTVADLRSRSTRYPRFYTWLLATFAGTALVLASVGLFGVVSYSVTQRTHEVGIRMALGAQAGHVLQLILRSGFLMTSIGMILGLGSTLGLARFLQAWIFEAGMSEVKPTEPAVLLAVSLFFAFVSFLASYIPARRATKLDPMVTLRHE